MNGKRLITLLVLFFVAVSSPGHGQEEPKMLPDLQEWEITIYNGSILIPEETFCRSNKEEAKDTARDRIKQLS